MYEAPKWDADSVHLPKSKLNTIKAFTERSYILHRVWAFGQEVGAEFVGGICLPLFRFQTIVECTYGLFLQKLLRFGDIGMRS